MLRRQTLESELRKNRNRDMERGEVIKKGVSENLPLQKCGKNKGSDLSRTRQDANLSEASGLAKGREDPKRRLLISG